MINPFSNEQILSIVEKTLTEVLGCAPDEIQPHHAIVNDLGAESLDFVELRHILEKKFGMTLPEGNILNAFEGRVGEAASNVIEAGKLTELGVFVLQRSLFRYDSKSIRVGMLQYEVFNATTVQQWANLCHGMFDYLPDVCPDCGHGQATVAPSGKAICAACSAVLKPAAGDDVLTRNVVAIAAAWEEQKEQKEKEKEQVAAV